MAPLRPYALPVEISLFHWLNFDGGPLLDAVGVALSDNRFGIGVGLVLAGFLLWTRRRLALHPILALGMAVAISDAVGARVLRNAFGRMRPCYALADETVRWLAPAANRGSLPSLHAANLFAMALVAAMADRRFLLPAYLAAVAVSWSRVYTGVHWPTDVLAGAAWGTMAGALAWPLTGIVVRRARARHDITKPPS